MYMRIHRACVTHAHARVHADAHAHAHALEVGFYSREGVYAVIGFYLFICVFTCFVEGDFFEKNHAAGGAPESRQTPPSFCFGC